ncbi:phospho-sugar mutase [uncultured Friedmanniella sp.]|uniref:phospho-sugar mutase n=1 Tax=uncultured Friedmanniella sp. TaxID=335381 RepID=UPI0035CB0042
MSRPLPPDLQRAISAWTAQDPDPTTRARTGELLSRTAGGEQDARDELVDAFTGRLAFGTAGLRGALGPGPNRMNRVVVGQAAAGLATYLLDTGGAGQPVLVGYDARHGSAQFARDTAEIMAAAGFETLLTPRPTPTPVVAFGIRHFRCAAAVMVTASHNPPQDNGYKVYLGDGSQIVPPADADIAARIEQVTRHALADVPRSDDYRVLGEELEDAYLERLATLVPTDAPRALRWVYTPMHGVGGSLVSRAVAAAGFPAAAVVAAQAEPDPDFPTVPFPNPEEPGAIDLALAQARGSGADLVVANDPDADRCAAAVVVDGGWRMLTGDELGTLLGEDALRRGVQGTYAASVVSSSLLSRIAAAYGQPFTTTLTGFKWIGRVPGLAFGYEEAIGYCVDPEAVPDKDGMSALLRVLQLAAGLAAEGRTLADRLDDIARTHGVHETSQLSFRVAELSLIIDAMARLRAAPPERLLGSAVDVVDLGPGHDHLPPTDAVMITGEMTKVVVRPSGTEPKLKCYLEVHLDPAPDVAGARAKARASVAQLREEMAGLLPLS